MEWIQSSLYNLFRNGTQKKATKQQISWITNDIKRLSRNKQRKYNLACRTKTDENWRAYHNLKKEVQRLCRSSHNNYVISLLDSHNKCTKKFWKYIKSMCKDQVSINTLQVDGKPYTDSSCKADILNNYFSSVFTKDDQSLPLTSAVSRYPTSRK